ncbi:hypothetical protein G210_2004 [Candida maltosa Xu316]|uniref:Uncharacterized protein n=1 Tax=Candida maltosa (strain Xu316) TaxID=1245528 RepID=M3HJR0_CANMX|nr:hypothetical protein G210_2004 [Candida maltosa Xu316]
MKFTTIYVAIAIVGTTQGCFLPLLECLTGGSSWGGNWGWGSSGTTTQPCEPAQPPPQPCETVVENPPCEY